MWIIKREKHTNVFILKVWVVGGWLREVEIIRFIQKIKGEGGTGERRRGGREGREDGKERDGGSGSSH